VTLPEELPVTETLELIREVDGDLRLPLGALVVNGVVPPLFSAEERRALAAHRSLETQSASSSANAPGANAVQAAARRAVEEAAQVASQARLSAGTKLAQIVLPYLFEDAATPSAIERLSAQF
jgi:hypothetical protein